MHIHTLIHPDQHGFIQGRSIYDPIRLNQTVCAYADYMEENGAIVVLDQEKAYDKIDHHYLIETLKCFNLPLTFINTISSLYKSATTVVLINGVLSSSYKVTRGVRQGDPLSCLLFNLAMEPLACSLRSTPQLEGFEIPGIKGKLIVSLYTNNTTIYLSVMVASFISPYLFHLILLHASILSNNGACLIFLLIYGCGLVSS